MIKSVGPSKLFSKRYNPILWIVGLTLLVAGLLAGSSVMGSRLVGRHAPQIGASHKIKIELAIGHLWFEECISGDDHREIAEVWAYFDQAVWYATAMLDGGENDDLSIVPLRDPELCRELTEIQRKLVSFREIAAERWAAQEQSGIGSEIDQRFDARFEEVMEGASRVESALQAAMSRELWEFKVVQGILVALCLGLGGVIGVLLHIFEKKKQKYLGTLHRSEENLSVTLNSIGDAVITTDLEGCVAGMNPVAEALTGWSEIEAITRPLDEVFRIIHAQTRKKAESPVVKVLREGIVVGLANHTALIARDGTEVQIADSAAPIRDPQGTILGVVLVFRDVTEEYAKEHQIRERAKELQCMYGLVESIRTRETLVMVFQDVAELIPPGWQFPEITRGRVVFEGKDYSSAPFEETPWKQSADILVGGAPCGSVEVFYLEEMPELDEGPFMIEERNLINGIARILGEAIEHRVTKDSLSLETGRAKGYLNLVEVMMVALNAQGFVTMINRKGCEVLGYDESEVLGKKWFDHFVPDRVVKDISLVSERLMHQESETIDFFENPIITKKGEERLIAWHNSPVRNGKGEIVGHLSSGEDITDRKQVEAEALLTKERLEMSQFSLDHSADSIFWINQDSSFFYVNEAACQRLGYTKADLLNLSVHDIDPGFPIERWNDFWDDPLRQKSIRFESVHQTKEGEAFPVEIILNIIQFGEKEYACAYAHDITEQKTLEDQFRQAQKMESIGQLVGGVAHDFNNLLQIINGYADVAHAQLGPEHVAVESVDEIAKAGAHARDLVQQLLTFSRQQVIDPADIDLNKEIKNSQRMLGRLIGEHIHVEFMAGKEMGTVFADRGQVQQVLMNLCVNARDAMTDGGTLTIKTESVSMGAEDLKAHIWAREGDYAMLSVRDTGCGMDKETCNRIFDPFFTTKEVGKGTGLGLSTVYGIVKQNDGHIDVTSELGKGTVFKIYLPVSKPLSEGASLLASENVAPVEEGTETILVVEDEKRVLELASYVLTDAGYKVLTASDGEEAVRVFEEHADEIDCVMMDVVMPRMGGKEAMEKILKINPALCHLFCSGYSPDTGHNDFIREEGGSLLSKPYQPDDLLRTLREVLDEE